MLDCWRDAGRIGNAAEVILCGIRWYYRSSALGSIIRGGTVNETWGGRWCESRGTSDDKSLVIAGGRGGPLTPPPPPKPLPPGGGFASAQSERGAAHRHRPPRLFRVWGGAVRRARASETQRDCPSSSHSQPLFVRRRCAAGSCACASSFERSPPGRERSATVAQHRKSFVRSHRCRSNNLSDVTREHPEQLSLRRRRLSPKSTTRRKYARHNSNIIIAIAVMSLQCNRTRAQPVLAGWSQIAMRS